MIFAEKDYLTIAFVGLAFCLSLYTFLSNNPKYNEAAPKFLAVASFQLLSALIAGLIIIINIYELLYIKILISIFWIIFLLSWLYIFYEFFKIYGRQYHLREKRYIKYIPF